MCTYSCLFVLFVAATGTSSSESLSTTFSDDEHYRRHTFIPTTIITRSLWRPFDDSNIQSFPLLRHTPLQRSASLHVPLRRRKSLVAALNFPSLSVFGTMPLLRCSLFSLFNSTHYLLAGVVFLQYEDETKRCILKEEPRTLDNVRQLFLRAFQTVRKKCCSLKTNSAYAGSNRGLPPTAARAHLHTGCD